MGPLCLNKQKKGRVIILLLIKKEMEERTLERVDSNHKVSL